MTPSTRDHIDAGQLPETILRYLAAHRAKDTDTAIQSYTADAVVEDEAKRTAEWRRSEAGCPALPPSTSTRSSSPPHGCSTIRTTSRRITWRATSQVDRSIWTTSSRFATSASLGWESNRSRSSASERFRGGAVTQR